MTTKQLNQYLAFAKQLALESGTIMLRYFRAADIGVAWKEDNTPVTVADMTINQLVVDRIKTTYPDHGVIGEEASFEPEREIVWVVDPIDGTVPYSLGMPASTFCLALVKRGEVQVSVVYDPFQERLYHATLGGGSFMNTIKLAVSKQADYQHSYFFGGSSAKPDQADLSHLITYLRKQGAKSVMLSNYSYISALVATGELLMAFMPYGSPWDAAAISLIVQEAGGRATDLKGNARAYNEWGEGILLSNAVIHDNLVKLIAEHAHFRD